MLRILFNLRYSFMKYILNHHYMRKLFLFLMLFTVWLGAWADGPNYGTRTGYWHEPAYRGSEPQKSTFGYIISDAGNLAYVSYAVKEGIGDYKTATLILANDIDMSAHYWDPMKNWKGSLNGNGHTIKNLYAYNASKNCGFVGYTEDNSVITIENVTFKNCYSQGENNSGIVMGNIDYGSTVTFSNVRLEECGLSSERWNNAGGFVGYVESSSEVTFQNCYSDVNVHSNTKVNVGGVHRQVGWRKKCHTDIRQLCDKTHGQRIFHCS